MHIIVSLVAGIVVAFPYIFWEFWRFIVPALYDQERNTARGAVFFTSLLFVLGVLFGYYIICPLSVNFLGNYKVSESVISAPTLRSYVQTITSVVLAAGLVFQLPILVYFLSKVGLVTPDFLKKYRRHSLVLIVTLSAIITPPDVFSQVLVALPLMVLYEIGIVISKSITKKQKEEMEEAEKSYRKKKKPAAANPDKEPQAEEPQADEHADEQAEEPQVEEQAEEPQADEQAETGEKDSVAKDDFSSRKPWKRPASKPEGEEDTKPDGDDSEKEDDETGKDG